MVYFRKLSASWYILLWIGVLDIASSASSSNQSPSPNQGKEVSNVNSKPDQHNRSPIRYSSPQPRLNSVIQRSFARLNAKIEKAKFEYEKRKEAGQKRKPEFDLEHEMKKLKISKD